jgi:hypothetical protein
VSTRVLGWGVGAAAMYVVVALASIRGWGLPPRPLFDGFAPPAPYNWVVPPAEFEAENQVPAGGELTFPTARSAGAQTVATEDAQALLSVPSGAFDSVPDTETVTVSLTPVDPLELGQPPAGLRLDGNAYVVEARNPESGAAATPDQPVIVFLRYPVHADRVLRWTGDRWQALDSEIISTSLEVYAATPELGTFVAAAPGTAPPPPPPPSAPHWATLGLLAAGAAVVGATAGLLARRRSAASRPRHRKR